MSTFIQIRKVDRHVYDVFEGTGFDHWSRVRKFHWGVKVLAGERLDRGKLNTLDHVLHHLPNGSLESVEIE